MAENDRERRSDDFEEYREDEEELTPIPTDMDEEQQDSVQEAPAGFVMADTDTEQEDEPVDADEQADFISVGTNPDGVMDQISKFTTDEDVLEDFEERQYVNSGSDQLLEQLREQTDRKPSLSGGDIDAAWEDSVVSGEESVGGSVSTPDQDVVEELGEALGIEYSDDEPLDTYAKLQDRDRDRWEMEPGSSEDSDVDELEADLEDEEYVGEDLDIYDDEDFLEEDLIEEDEELIDVDYDDLAET